MDSYSELLIEAISQNDLNCVRYCLQKGAKANKICSSGITPLGAAARSGNFQILQLLADSTRKVLDLDMKNENTKPIVLQLDMSQERCKNIGYFVVCKDLDDNDLGEGPTPDGMEALEWDMEIADENIDEEIPTPPEIGIYKWYAKILNQTSFVLKSPENDIGRLDRNGQNVLHYAIQIGNEEMVEYLLNNFTEISVNQTSSDWLTPLHLAVLHGKTKIVHILIEKRANVNALNANRETPLHFAVQKGNLALVNILLENNANLNAYDMMERSPLTVAVLNHNEEIAKLLIRKGTRLNHEETHGFTVLHRAVWNNLTNTTKCLLEAGAKVIQSHYLLHIATRNNNLDILQLLHKAGAVLNIRDEQGNTPLMLACKMQHFYIAKYLLQSGAPVNTANHINGMTALHICVQDIRDSVIFQQFLELLISYKADLNANSFQGNVLFYAIIMGNLKCAGILIKYGVDVNRRDEHAYFDNLSLAKKHGNVDLVRLMIHAGFNINNMLFDVKSLKNSQEDHIFDYLMYIKSNPLNLRELCRIKIRKELGKNLITKIYQLPLPTIMQKYLALDIW